MIPLDLDVSPFDNSKTNKGGVSMTYKGYDGYGPIFAYLGKDGYLVNLELRERKQHCQKGTVEFLEESIKYSKIVTDAAILVRLDSGNDSLDNIRVYIQEGVGWIINCTCKNLFESIYNRFRLPIAKGPPRMVPVVQ